MHINQQRQIDAEEAAINDSIRRLDRTIQRGPGFTVALEGGDYTITAEDVELAKRTKAGLGAQRKRGEDIGNIRELYHELIYEVSMKIPGESRHETARRIIHNHENRQNSQPEKARG